MGRPRGWAGRSRGPRSQLMRNGATLIDAQERHAAGDEEGDHDTSSRSVASPRPNAAKSASASAATRRSSKGSSLPFDTTGSSRGPCRRGRRHRRGAAGRQRRHDGGAAIRFAHQGSTARHLAASVGHLVDDGVGVFEAGVVRGDDHPVGQSGGDLTHHRSLGPVPVPTAPEHQVDPPAAGQGTHPGEQLGGGRRGYGRSPPRPPPGPPGATISKRPGSGATPDSPRAMVPGSTPRTSAAVAAARALERLNEPGSGRWTRRPRQVNVVPRQHPVWTSDASAREYGHGRHHGGVEEQLAPRIVHVDHRLFGQGRLEQLGLRCEVRLHGDVVVEVLGAESLVKMATRKRVPLTRPWSRAWEETSTAAAPAPPSRRAARRRWSSGPSGVLGGPPGRAVRLPMTPVGRPAAPRTGSDEVGGGGLAVVPVTPTTSMSWDGWSRTAAAAAAPWRCARRSPAPEPRRGGGGARRAAPRHPLPPQRRPGRGRPPGSQGREQNSAPGWTSPAWWTTLVTSTASGSPSSERTRGQPPLGRGAQARPSPAGPTATGSASEAATVGSGASRRRDAELTQGVAGDVGEDGSGGEAAVEHGPGFVEHHDDRELGVLGGDEPGERRHVGTGLVAAPLEVGLLGRPRLPRHRVALDGPVPPRPVAHHVGQHVSQRRCGVLGHDLGADRRLDRLLSRPARRWCPGRARARPAHPRWPPR